ncbi:MAG: sigma-70 family RNA polymerase sigma factor [Lachnospiraceae bacterium]|nr:sigma-70 family RNA polymerase sigma factor [Lachnospiraceae bacterium]
MQEQELFCLIEQDPQQGFTELMRRYGALAASVARNLLYAGGFGEADVEDVLAESLQELFRNREQLDFQKGSLKALFCSIVRHKAIDRLRQNREEIPLSELLDLPDDFSLEERILEKALKEEVLAAVRSLKEPEREIILRKYYLGQSTKEIAACLKLSPGSVDVKTHRAVQRLREVLGEA